MTTAEPVRIAEALRRYAHLLGGVPFVGRSVQADESDDWSRWYPDPDDEHVRYQSITWTIESTQSAPWVAPWASGVTAELAVEHAALLLDLAADDPRAAVRWLKEESRRQRELAAEVGTWHHDVLEALLLDRSIPDPQPWMLGRTLRTGGEVIPITQETLDQWADGITAFIADYRIEPVMSEATICSPQKRYAGRTDVVAHLPGYGLVAIDMKSGRVRRSVIAQLAATVHATEVWLPRGGRIPMPACDVAAVLHLRPRWQRGYKLRPVRGPELAAGWRWFQRANESLISREAAPDIDGLVMYPPTFGPDGEVLGIPQVPMVEDLGIRCARVLAAEGFTWLDELTEWAADDLLSDTRRQTGIKGVGPAAIKDLRRVLAQHRLALAGESLTTKGAA